MMLLLLLLLLLCYVRLWWDLLTTLPWDDIVLAATGHYHDSQAARYIGLLGLLKLVRQGGLGARVSSRV
jgi:hypothetical protein